METRRRVVVLFKRGLMQLKENQGTFKRRNSCFKSEDAEEICRSRYLVS